jgi:adenine-specific DNA-methyltransferase
MNKQDLIQKLKTLDGLSADEKSALINLVNTKKKYGLVWEDKIEDVEEELREKLPVLKEVKEKAIINNDVTLSGVEVPNHILIEGDNLHALTALTFTHEGKIDIIYIDPPYNTKNKDFKYNDTYVDNEDSFRHSKWLSFMHKRLQIAKRLLSESGSIFISIDDNEQSQLKMLCNEVFGEENFLANTVWQHSLQAKGYTDKFSVHHNYTICYKKSSQFELGSLTRTDEHNKNYSNPDNDPKGKWRSGDVRNALVRKNLMYDISTPSGKLIKHPPKGWRFSFETFQKELADGKIIFSKDESRIIRKIYLADQDGRGVETIWFGKEVGTTRDATQTLKEIFNSTPFETPKPLGLLERIIRIGGNNSAVILDFFAGSGTTLHATLQLNEKDGGNRQCILVTDNENNICEDITYERNKRIISGYKFTGKKRVELFQKMLTLDVLENSSDILDKLEEIKMIEVAKGNTTKLEFKDGELKLWRETVYNDEIPGLKNNNLRYYKSDYVSRETSLKNKRQLTLLATELLSIKEDCYNDITTEFSSDKWLKLFNNASGKLICVIYDDVEIEAGIKIIQEVLAKYNPSQKIKVYVFSNGQYPYTEDFEDILENIELCALPDAIYKAYQNVLPKRKRTEVPEIEDPTAEEVETATDLFNQNSEK